LFNASPDIREQIAANSELQPSPEGGLRNTPIATVVLTNADVDHIAGLLSLRERQKLVIYATANVLKTLAENSIFNVLNPDFVERRELPLSGTTELEGPDGPIGIEIETFPVPGKVALFLEDEAASDGNFGTSEGDTIGVRIAETGKGGHGGRDLFYIPGCARVTGDLKDRLNGANVLLFDGTVFVDDEMSNTGVGEKTGARMGHMAISGPQGSIAQLAGIDIGRRIFVHINNTNPILEPGSEAEQYVLDAGWQVSFDGMELNLD
jgi:pyrroloquinoline quinone biosynthesis protein B